ncbi:MAG: hypothetical protein ACI4E1_02435 [Lachnospira sp.]
MMSYKNRLKILAVISVIFMVVIIVGIIDVNKRFPKAEYLEYNKETPANISGLEIMPVSNKIYTWDQFKTEYSSYDHYDDWSKSENDRLVVFEIKVKNTISDDIWFKSILMEMFDENSCFSNGVSVIEPNMVSPIIAPGEEKTLHIVTFISAGNMTKRQMDDLKEEKLGLTLSYYPQYKVLKFEAAQD